MAAPVSFIGGMNVPGVIGRMNASVPLAKFIIDGAVLTLRPRAFGWMMTTEFEVRVENVEAAYKLRRTPYTLGIGIRLRDGRVAFFWTFSADRVLAALAANGVNVLPGRHRARGLFRWGTSPAVPIPTFPVLLVTLTQIVVLAATAVMVTIIVSADSWTTRAWAAFVWSAFVACSTAVWRLGKRRSES